MLSVVLVHIFVSLCSINAGTITHIKIYQSGDRIQFSAVNTESALPKQYEIESSLEILVQSELAKSIVLQDKNTKFESIPLQKDSDRDDNHHYHVQLHRLGDFCFVKLSSEKMERYCFRVLPRDLSLIYIQNYDNDLHVLKRKIQQELHISADKSTVIAINVAFETRGVLIRELLSQKLLFLIQHIIDKLLPFLSSNDLILTLPTSSKLRAYNRATASERVALIVHNARKKRKELQASYELQYAQHTEPAFGGAIIINNEPRSSDTEVASREINVADFVISVGALSKMSNHADAFGVSVKQKHSRKKNHICFSKVEQLKTIGYDHLFDVANKIGKCILRAMGVKNVDAVNIYITNGFNVNINTLNATQSIDFELVLQDGECCVLEIAAASVHRKLYKHNDGDAGNRQIILLKGNQITVVPSKALLSSNTSIAIQDIVFYVEFMVDDDDDDISVDWSSHSKIKSLHYLMYSSKEYVPISTGLFYLCASWTMNTVQNTKCSDDLYFNINFLMSNDDLKSYEVDSSGFMSLQLIHLQNLYKTILETRNELNQQTEDEGNMEHNLMLHELASSSYKHHLTQLHKIYEYELDKSGENVAERKDLQKQLKITQQRLQNDQLFEKQYSKSLEIFNAKEIKDPLKKKAELIRQISHSQQQITRLRLEMRQKQQMLDSLQQEIDSIQIHST